MQTRRKVTVTLTLMLEPGDGVQGVTDDQLAASVSQNVVNALPSLFWVGKVNTYPRRWRHIRPVAVSAHTEPVAG